MMESTNEPAPADGQRKLEQQTHDNIEQSYQELLKKDQDAMSAKLQGEATAKFDEVRRLGFATNDDIKKQVEGVYGKFIEEVKTLREENTKLREWVMRAKAQGLNSGVTEDSTPQNTLRDKFKPRW